MRYVPVHRLKEGMVLGKPFYGGKFEVLLAAGMTLTSYHVQRINEMGYAGGYILEDMAQDVVLRDLLPPEIRLGAIQAAREFVLAASGRGVQIKGKVPKEKQEKIVMPIIRTLIDTDSRIVDVIDLKPYNYYDYYHAANCVVLSLLIGVELGISGQQLYELGMAALLHDIGNVFIPNAIREKPDKLSPEEYETVKSHAEKGFEHLRENYDLSIDACVGALHHHENYDGSGYPTGLKKDKISIYGRIIAITDVYDALVSRRPYREAMYPPEAMELIHARSGTMFDPEIIAVLDRVVSLYPTGICVELDTGVACLVVQNYPGVPARPRLKVLNQSAKEPIYVDLYKDPVYKNNKITKILDY